MNAIPNSPAPSPDTAALRLILPELYSEQRHRRDYSMKAVFFYAGFCAASIGWVVANPMAPIPRYILALLLMVVGTLGVFNLERHARSYSNTAQVIVRICRDLGLFAVLPEHWSTWGRSVRRWPQFVMLLAGVTTATFLILCE